MAFIFLDMGLRVEFGEIGVHGGAETNNGGLVVSGVMEDISTNDHGVLRDAGWGFGFPEDLAGLAKNLKGDVVHY